MFSAIYGYLEHVTYPAGLTKSKIFVLRMEVAKITSFLKASCNKINMLANMLKLFH